MPTLTKKPGSASSRSLNPLQDTDRPQTAGPPAAVPALYERAACRQRCYFEVHLSVARVKLKTSLALTPAS